MNDKERPAEPVVGDEGTVQGGFAKVAEHLNTLYPTRQRPISRQLVHKWWINRHFNRFPEAVEAKGSGNGGKGRPVFNLAAVAEWHEEYLRTRGGLGGRKSSQTATASRTTGDGKSSLAA